MTLGGNKYITHEKMMIFSYNYDRTMFLDGLEKLYKGKQIN